MNISYTGEIVQNITKIGELFKQIRIIKIHIKKTTQMTPIEKYYNIFSSDLV